MLHKYHCSPLRKRFIFKLALQMRNRNRMRAFPQDLSPLTHRPVLQSTNTSKYSQTSLMRYSEHQHSYFLSSAVSPEHRSKPTFRKRRSRCIYPLNNIAGEKHLPGMQFWAKGWQGWGSHVEHTAKYHGSCQELPDQLQLDFTKVPPTAITRSRWWWVSKQRCQKYSLRAPSHQISLVWHGVGKW